VLRKIAKGRWKRVFQKDRPKNGSENSSAKGGRRKGSISGCAFCTQGGSKLSLSNFAPQRGRVFRIGKTNIGLRGILARSESEGTGRISLIEGITH